MLESITPVILTFNEEANIASVLASVAWAKTIIVVDSGSTDGTLDILKANPAVRLFHRPFDNHWNQWSFAISQTDIDSEWVLRLDADYVLTEELIAELRGLNPPHDIAAYRIRFGYAIWGKRLIGSLYPPNVVLFRAGQNKVVPRGHTEGWEPQGRVVELSGKIIHDDRKPVTSFVAAQQRYMQHEATAVEGGKAGVASWLRRHPPLMPIFVLFYCLFAKGLILSGPAGWFYTMQRVAAEAILSLILLERRFQRAAMPDNGTAAE